MSIPTIDHDTYVREKEICDKADAYWKANADYDRSGASLMSAEKAQHPDYAACDNAMRSRVEQYEILNDPPSRLVAYVGDPNRDGMGRDRVVGQTCPITTWAGDLIGFATVRSSWRVRSFIGTHMHQYYARVAGREYTGRGFGVGMSVMLRETAASKRAEDVANS